jgi:hypothetical protein
MRAPTYNLQRVQRPFLWNGTGMHAGHMSMLDTLGWRRDATVRRKLPHFLRAATVVPATTPNGSISLQLRQGGGRGTCAMRGLCECIPETAVCTSNTKLHASYPCRLHVVSTTSVHAAPMSCCFLMPNFGACIPTALLRENHRVLLLTPPLFCASSLQGPP